MICHPMFKTHYSALIGPGTLGNRTEVASEGRKQTELAFRIHAVGEKQDWAEEEVGCAFEQSHR